jgi:hypothetical protein
VNPPESSAFTRACDQTRDSRRPCVFATCGTIKSVKKPLFTHYANPGILSKSKKGVSWEKLKSWIFTVMSGSREKPCQIPVQVLPALLSATCSGRVLQRRLEHLKECRLIEKGDRFIFYI